MPPRLRVIFNFFYREKNDNIICSLGGSSVIGKRDAIKVGLARCLRLIK